MYYYNTLIFDFQCKHGHPIETDAKKCVYCDSTGMVTLECTYNPNTGWHHWEIFMGEPSKDSGASLLCLLCSRPIVSLDRRCIACDVYSRLALVEIPRDVHIKYGHWSCRWQVHQFVSRNEVPDRMGSSLLFVKNEKDIPQSVKNKRQIPQPVETDRFILNFLAKDREKFLLREKARLLLKDNTWRKTAEILDISLGKLQSRVKEDPFPFLSD